MGNACVGVCVCVSACAQVCVFRIRDNGLKSSISRNTANQMER